MKKQIVILLLVVPILSFSQTWNPIGPDSANISRIDFGVAVQYHALCADNGFYLYNYGNNTCEFFSYGGMSVTGAGYFNNEKILVAMGDGSWSDGVYTFDLSTHDFEVMDWFVWPNFLHYHEAAQTWWVGSDWGGLWKSEDGMLWDTIHYFDTIHCTAIAHFENHLVVTSSSNQTIYYSENFGVTWNRSPYFIPITDLTFTNEGIIYGVLPWCSNSSGLRKSLDFGYQWENEYYMMWMTSVCMDVFSQIILGFDEEGIALYTPGQYDLTFLNGDLPCLNINKIQVNPTMSAPALFVSTDQGAYYSYDYYVGIDEDENNGAKIQLSPNPAKDQLLINSETLIKGFEISDMKGNQLLKEIVSEKNIRIDLNRFSSGIYFLTLQSKSGTSIRKFVIN